MVSGDYWERMPVQATTSYPIFVSLRFLNIAVFWAVANLTIRVTTSLSGETLTRRVLLVSALVALGSVYMYFAPFTGLPDLPRTRIHTDGGEPRVLEGTYGFFRARGPFREPSHLAEWLLLPLFLSFAVDGIVGTMYRVLFGVVMVLTGALTGFLSFLVGVTVAFAAQLAEPRQLWRSARRSLAALSVAAGVGGALVMNSTVERGEVFKVLWGRTARLWEGGLGASNRDYIYRYVATRGIPAFGVGLGHANIELAESIGFWLPASHLSLYLNVLYAAGPVGLALLGGVLAAPVLRLLRGGRRVVGREAWVLGAYAAVLTAFAVRAEEPYPSAGLLFGLLAARALSRRNTCSGFGSLSRRFGGRRVAQEQLLA